MSCSCPVSMSQMRMLFFMTTYIFIFYEWYFKKEG